MAVLVAEELARRQKIIEYVTRARLVSAFFTGNHYGSDSTKTLPLSESSKPGQIVVGVAFADAEKSMVRLRRFAYNASYLARYFRVNGSCETLARAQTLKKSASSSADNDTPQ